MLTLQSLTRSSVLMPSVLGGLPERSFFSDRPGLLAPGMDLAESDDAYLVRLALPGVRPDAIRLHLEERDLVVRADLGDARRWSWLPFRRDRADVSGEVCERITLPGPANAEGAQAECGNGILTVRLPKAAPTGRRIAVRFQGRPESSRALPGIRSGRTPRKWFRAMMARLRHGSRRP